uniref:Uncharacterized protein n=1 Tax=Ananas comosus var. bracteatus TaxID=296719 RepID=A0A6V7QA07_ANACO|nr:unnamed protein product [Ananas comosus var. bracteatus]
MQLLFVNLGYYFICSTRGSNASKRRRWRFIPSQPHPLQPRSYAFSPTPSPSSRSESPQTLILTLGLLSLAPSNGSFPSPPPPPAPAPAPAPASSAPHRASARPRFRPRTRRGSVAMREFVKEEELWAAVRLRIRTFYEFNESCGVEDHRKYLAERSLKH